MFGSASRRRRAIPADLAVLLDGVFGAVKRLVGLADLAVDGADVAHGGHAERLRGADLSEDLGGGLVFAESGGGVAVEGEVTELETDHGDGAPRGERLVDGERLFVSGAGGGGIAQAGNSLGPLHIAKRFVAAGQLLAAGTVRGLFDGGDTGAEVGDGSGNVALLRQQLPDTPVGAGEIEVGLGIGGRAADKFLGDGQGLAVAGKGGGGVALIETVWIALDITEAEPRFGDFASDSGVAAGLGAEAAEVFDCGLDDDVAGVGGAGQVLDAVVEVEEEFLGEAADVGEVALGAGAFAEGDDQPYGQQGYDEGGGHHRHAIPAHEAARAVAERLGTRADGNAVQVAADVTGELLDRDVTARGLVLERLMDDDVEVALESRVVDVGPRRVASQQLVEDDAERVDVGGGRDGPASACSGLAYSGRHQPQAARVSASAPSSAL